MLTRHYPIKYVTCLLGWLRNVLCHVVMGKRAADIFGVVGVGVVIMNINIT